MGAILGLGLGAIEAGDAAAQTYRIDSPRGMLAVETQLIAKQIPVPELPEGLALNDSLKNSKSSSKASEKGPPTLEEQIRSLGIQTNSYDIQFLKHSLERASGLDGDSLNGYILPIVKFSIDYRTATGLLQPDSLKTVFEDWHHAWNERLAFVSCVRQVIEKQKRSKKVSEQVAKKTVFKLLPNRFPEEPPVPPPPIPAQKNYVTRKK